VVTIAIEDDRVAQLLIAHEEGLDIDDARRRLERSALILTIDDAAGTQWGQAAALAIARCATRMFRGGVFCSDGASQPLVVSTRRVATLRRALLDLGCRDTGLPGGAFRIHIGHMPSARSDLYVTADGWRAIVSPQVIEHGVGNTVSGALAGAMATSEAFRRVVLEEILACRRTISLSAWDPAEPLTGSALRFLPKHLWLLGLGNLGQATMFVASLLPFPDPADVLLMFQDYDRSGPENLQTQILTGHDWIGRPKARALADWAEGQGFRPAITERRFRESSFIGADEPRIGLIGVDRLEPRRWASARFDVSIDAGLGASAGEIFDIRLHAFPGRREASTAWPVPDDDGEPVLNAGLRKLVDQGRLDTCGAVTLAGQSLGVPSTAVAAAALQFGQLCRMLATRRYCDFIDLSIANPERVTAQSFDLPDTVSLAMLRAAPAC
jgi:hypothetical protein